MEEAAGVCLGLPWRKFEHSEAKPIPTSLLDVEAEFQRLRLSDIGILYFKEDVSEEFQTLSLFSENKDAHNAQFLERYSIGPIIDRQWWRGERACLDLDRDPCRCLLNPLNQFCSFQGLMQQLILLRQPRTNGRFSITLKSPPVDIVDIHCTAELYTTRNHRLPSWRNFVSYSCLLHLSIRATKLT